MEPEETVTALKIRERVRGKKEREEDRSWKDRQVEVEIREEGGSCMEESAGGQTQSRAMEKGMCNVTKRGRGRARGCCDDNFSHEGTHGAARDGNT